MVEEGLLIARRKRAEPHLRSWCGAGREEADVQGPGNWLDIYRGAGGRRLCGGIAHREKTLPKTKITNKIPHRDFSTN